MKNIKIKKKLTMTKNNSKKSSLYFYQNTPKICVIKKNQHPKN